MALTLFKSAFSRTPLPKVPSTKRLEFFKEHHFAYADSDYGRSIGEWLDADQFQPAVTERLFVNTLLRTYPEFAQIHLHSAHTLRNGFTLLQKKAPLTTQLGEAA